MFELLVMGSAQRMSGLWVWRGGWEGRWMEREGLGRGGLGSGDLGDGRGKRGVG